MAMILWPQWRRTCDQEVAGSIRGPALLRNDCGQVVHTHVPLSPSSIIWYQCTWEVTVGYARGVV